MSGYSMAGLYATLAERHRQVAAEADAQNRVARGAALLDEHSPGWATIQEPAIWDEIDGSVLAQAAYHADWNPIDACDHAAGLIRLYPTVPTRDRREASIRDGFDATGSDDHYALTAAWATEVRKRTQPAEE